MAVLDSPTLGAPATRTPRAAWVALALALVGATSYVVALVLPYYAASLDQRPAGEPLYEHELSGLWPYDSPFGGAVGLLAMWALAVAPFAAVAVAAWSVHRLWTTRAVAGARAVTVAALVVSVATVGWTLTPLHAELVVWLLD